MTSIQPYTYVVNDDDPSLLDLFSTKESLETHCIHNSPLICVPPHDGQHGHLYQACCNDWNCPVHGQARAKYEYGRMVVGARKLALEHKLYMMTLTLPGTISLADGEASYYERTHRLHANINYRARTDEIPWHYAAVTERQVRGHPHSHYLTTFCPPDAYFITDEYERYTLDVQHINANIPLEMRYSPAPIDDIDNRQMFSVWLSLAAVKAELGVQCRMAIADLVEGASRYIAKYLFKTAMFEVWPKGWKRVRYTRNWPKMPDYPNTTAFPVITQKDWHKLLTLPGIIETADPGVYEQARRHLAHNVVLAKLKEG